VRSKKTRQHVKPGGAASPHYPDPLELQYLVAEQK
jgi:hypothetical protein